MGMDERLLGMFERDQRPPRGSCENYLAHIFAGKKKHRGGGGKWPQHQF